MAALLWFLTRASGIVALALLLAAVVCGSVFSGREGGRRLRPAWWMDLHRGLGGYALFFTGFHLLTAFGADLGVGLTQLLVPGTAPQNTTAYTLGVLAFYGIAVTVLTSWPKRRLGRRAWHLLHLISIPAAVMAAVHAYQLGTDALAPWYVAASVLAAGVTVYPLTLRLTGLARSRSAGRAGPAGKNDRQLEPVGSTQER